MIKSLVRWFLDNAFDIDEFSQMVNGAVEIACARHLDNVRKLASQMVDGRIVELVKLNRNSSFMIVVNDEVDDSDVDELRAFLDRCGVTEYLIVKSSGRMNIIRME